MESRTREEYFAVALDLLAAGGAKAVTIAALCERLGVTKGSFYHHFTSGPAFLQDLLRHWESAFGTVLAREAVAVADPAERLATLRAMAVDLHHEAESAIRALARTDPFAAAVQQRVDAERLDVVAGTLEALGLPTDQAADLARLGLSLLVGAQQLETPVDRARLDRLLDVYQSMLVTAADPST